MNAPAVIDDRSPPPARATPRWMFWTGWVLTLGPGLLMVSAVLSLGGSNPDVAKGLEQVGWPVRHERTIVLMQVACGVLYLLPWTAVLGAILMTGFLGGAVATHLRVEDGMWFVPVIFGVVVWLGLFLRDARVRAVVPWRRAGVQN